MLGGGCGRGGGIARVAEAATLAGVPAVPSIAGWVHCMACKMDAREGGEDCVAMTTVFSFY